MNTEQLRKKYKEFVYKDFNYKTTGANLKIWFDFLIKPNLNFKTEVTIKNIKKSGLKDIDNFVFHLGLIEMLNYWKLTCSPIINIEAGNLDKNQIAFLEKIIINGMGQYFYENKIDFTKPDFIKIITSKSKSRFNVSNKKLNDKKVLIPVGGGKDAPITIEMFKKRQKNLGTFVLNAFKPQKDIIKIAGLRENIFIERKLDEKLFTLNKKGFLNGHVPFSAFLSFLGIFLANIFDYKTVVFSWEKSANEGNVKYKGKWINHQWSKSIDFEKLIQNYTKKYLLKDVKIYSPLRKFSELEIAKKFSKLKKYHSSFLSCNNAYKIKGGSNGWCGQCAKCLFVFTALYPFMEEKKLIRIFNKNLFEDKKLIPLMEQLIGNKKFKPFDCVGTTKENISAFSLSLKKAKKQKQLPILLVKFKTLTRRIID
ncbi:MAG: hypothetical protein NTY11_02595 [Candidatus Parcubacteria bacterium]|nr:hypothetical protein [Candidatus Parcubacteria bacterium]